MNEWNPKPRHLDELKVTLKVIRKMYLMKKKHKSVFTKALGRHFEHFINF